MPVPCAVLRTTLRAQSIGPEVGGALPGIRMPACPVGLGVIAVILS
jgi:hypothetical protein